MAHEPCPKCGTPDEPLQADEPRSASPVERPDTRCVDAEQVLMQGLAAMFDPTQKHEVR